MTVSRLVSLMISILFYKMLITNPYSDIWLVLFLILHHVLRLHVRFHLDFDQAKTDMIQLS